MMSLALQLDNLLILEWTNYTNHHPEENCKAVWIQEDDAMDKEEKNLGLLEPKVFIWWLNTHISYNDSMPLSHIGS